MKGCQKNRLVTHRSLLVNVETSLDRPKLVVFWTSPSQRIKVSSALTLTYRLQCLTPHGHATGPSIRICTRNWSNGHGVDEWGNRSRPAPARRSAPPHGETECVSTLGSHRHHRPTDCTQASQIPPGQASGDRLLSSHHQRVTFTFVNDGKFQDRLT